MADETEAVETIEGMQNWATVILHEVRFLPYKYASARNDEANTSLQLVHLVAGDELHMETDPEEVSGTDALLEMPIDDPVNVIRNPESLANYGSGAYTIMLVSL